MLSKKFTPILAFLLVVIVIFFVVQVLNILTSKSLPTADSAKLQPVNPQINSETLKDLEEGQIQP